MADVRTGFPDWDVDVVVGPTPETLQHPTRDEGFMQMAPGEFLAIIEDVGRMHVTADRVVVDPLPGRSVAEMDYLVYGWAPRWVRILREEYALHASAVIVGSGALALMGFSGAGKSTTTTALVHRGYDLLIDDVLPVDLVDGRPFVHGWERPVHLVDDAAAHFAIPADSRVGKLTSSKVSATLPQVAGEWPLLAAVELCAEDDADTVTSRRLAGADRLRAVLEHANGAGFSAADGRSRSFFDWATTLASAVEVVRITRPTTGWHLDAVIDAIESVIGTLDLQEESS